MTSVLIADDHVVVRKGLKQLFELIDGLVVAGEAANGDEVLKLLQTHKFDMILLDLTMPGISGVELIEAIRSQEASLPILVLSMNAEPSVAKRVLQSGASGYITKGCNEDLLIAAIRRVAAGEHFIEPVMAEQMIFESKLNNEQNEIEQLSERELQIMKCLAQGKTITEIAYDFGISYKTVSTHKSRLMIKMDFKSNAELVLYASKHGLIEDKTFPH